MIEAVIFDWIGTLHERGIGPYKDAQKTLEALRRGGIKMSLISIAKDEEKEARNIDVLMLRPEPSGSFSFTKLKKNNKVVENIKEGDGSYYLDTPTLIGVIFSEDELVYQCNLLKAFKRYQYVSSLYQFKAWQLKDDSSLSHCSVYYKTAYDYLGSDVNLGTTINVKIESDVAATVAAKQSLEDLNEEILLAPGGRCPRLY